MPEYVEEEQELPKGISAPIPEGPSEDFFKFRIEGRDILEDIEHQLKGEVWDAEKKRYIVKFDRWVNDEGVNKILHVIYACGINKNIILGNLTTDEIKFKCRSLKRDIAFLLFKKYHDYGIKKEMRSLLTKSVVNQIHSGLSRSEGGRESDQISTAAQRHDIWQHQDQQQSERRGILGRLKLRKSAY